jgi:type I restriction enzyme S subunit
MDADLFLQKFGHLAQSEGGIKKLRDVILQLAVRGKLIEQCPTDESSLAFLKSIELAKKLLVDEGILKKSEQAICLPKDIKFRVASWHYVVVESVWYTLSPIKKIKNSDFLEHGKYPIIDQGQSHIAGYSNADDLLVKIPHPVIVFGDHTRAIKYIDFDFCPGADGTKTIVPILINPKYFYVFLKSVNLEDRGYGRHFKLLKKEIIPIPPLAEQKRIVAKVDELMALCDKLEAEQNAQRTLKTQAVQSTLHQLTSSETPSAFGSSFNILNRTFGNWFDDLATVKHLRATILQLAIQGKLAPQDPSDEPASELLERIYVEKKRILGEKSDKSDLYTKSHTELPAGWILTSIENLGSIRGGKRIPKSYSFSDEPTSHVYIRVTDMKNGAINLTNLKYISEEVFAQIKNYTISKNDIYVTIAGTIGECGKVPDELHGMNLTENAAKISPYAKDLVCNSYVILAIQSEYIQSQFKLSTNQQAQPKLALNKIASTLIPLPPLAEQKRIVAKVDELMKLCDQLEVHITNTQTLNTHLMDSLIHRMTKAA